MRGVGVANRKARPIGHGRPAQGALISGAALFGAPGLLDCSMLSRGFEHCETFHTFRIAASSAPIRAHHPWQQLLKEKWCARTCSSQCSPRCVEATAICSETQHAPSGAHHLLHEAFLADKADHSKCAGLVQFFDFLKLAGLHVCGIISLSYYCRE